MTQDVTHGATATGERARVKVCGVTTVGDAELCVVEGADAIGLNFWSGSPRCCDVPTARRIVDAVGAHTLVVGVFVDETAQQIVDIMQRAGVACAQLHGDESPSLLEGLLPHAYKALRVRGPQTIDEARTYGGKYLLLDSYVPGLVGGTGAVADWDVAAAIASTRRVVLAGGLRAENVAAAIAAVRPWCVDVASGVEQRPGVKDPLLVREFIQQVGA